jgi:hypothetical protein
MLLEGITAFGIIRLVAPAEDWTAIGAAVSVVCGVVTGILFAPLVPKL